MTDPPHSPRGLLLVAPVVLAGLAGMGFLRALDEHEVDRGFPLDDSWIHMRFAANWAAGKGFGCNPGEPTPGSTAPLWVALLAAAAKIGLPLERAANGMGMALSAAAAALLMLLSRKTLEGSQQPDQAKEAMRTWLPLGVGMFYVLTPCVIWSSVSGLEIALFMALSFAGLLLHEEAYHKGGWRWPVSAVLFGLATNARPEGNLLFALAAIEKAWWEWQHAMDPRPRRLRRLALYAGLYVLMIAPYVTFCFFTTGRPLPNTYYAKAIGGRNIWSRHFFQLLVERLGKEHFWLGLLAPVGMVAFLSRRRGALLPALWVIALPLGYTFMPRNVFTYDAGNFNRYFYPVVPLLAMFGVCGLAIAATALGSRVRHGPALLGVALSAACLTDSLSLALDRRGQFVQNVKNINDLDVAAAQWLRDHTPQQARLCVCDAGAIPYFAHRRIFDTVGLVTPALIPFRRAYRIPGELFDDTALARFMTETRPDYLVIFPDWYPKLVSDLDRAKWAQKVKTFAIEDNITCGGDTMAVYRLNW